MKILLTLMILIFIFNGETATPPVRCGIAIGFPPYQYVDRAGQAAGIDVEVAKLVFKTAGLKIEFVPGEWDFLLSSLIYKTGEIDLVCGAEINEKRVSLLDFSDPFYKRHIVLFTLKKSPINKISDLYGKFITGDKDSFFEKYLGHRKEDIRIVKTTSKEESFKKLQDGSVVAVIAPKEVGFFIAKKLKMEVKVLEEKDPGSPVGFAVSKGNTKLMGVIQKSLRQLQRSGQIDLILKNESLKKY